MPEATYSDPEFWLASGYPTVFRDATGVWRCLYQGKPRAEPQEARNPLLLENDDGLCWQAPDLTRAVPTDERRFRNQVMPVTKFREWDCYFDACAEDPAERLKALVTHHSGAGAARRTVARRSARSAQHRVLKRTAQLVRDQRPSDAAQPAGWRCQRGGSPASL